MEMNEKIRLRRLRKTDLIRQLVAETNVNVNDLVYPIFIKEGRKIKEGITNIPNIYRYSIDNLDAEIEEIKSLGIKTIILFGIPKFKNESGDGAYIKQGIIQKTVRHLREVTNDLTIITDVCLCQYINHGHCGVIKNDKILNDASLSILSKIALSHAEEGADFVAPAAMMDHQVRTLRAGLDKENYQDTGILSYSAKYASSLYHPFRNIANSHPTFGDRESYQMNITNSKEALREIDIDIHEGADIIIVKPALFYLDIISKAKNRFDIPIAAYNVSGEYAMIMSAVQNNLLDKNDVIFETITSIKRAGADIIITYFAKDIVNILKNKNQI